MALTSSNFGQIMFGAGTGVMTPYATNGPTNPTPIQIPIVQEFNIDISADEALLYGQDQFPYGIARTKTKIEIKSKFGAVYTHLLSDVFFGVTPTAGQTLFSQRESVTITTHAGTVAHSANFIADLGVLNATTGVPYTAVASAPAVGQYTVSAGVYTFNSSDTITTAYITYTYNSASTGLTAAVTNNPMGAMPTFIFDYLNNQFGSNLYMHFYKCVAKKIGMPNKNTEFEMFDFDFDAFSLTNGSVFNLSLDE